MKTNNIKLPKQTVTRRFNFVNHSQTNTVQTSSSKTDPTNTCTTLFTTTHYV
ncbi:hypothetical protein [Mucilaginibacter ginsenosidivorax]|uniref:hypothetical protein n=1 Tax=Mucilaginibacter ginsenosidivorax TaxID=862126 RepID=UPI0013153A56|nr:hypothetical protein [Mucilaginibacter ginsenosidivorax]